MSRVLHGSPAAALAAPQRPSARSSASAAGAAVATAQAISCRRAGLMMWLKIPQNFKCSTLSCLANIPDPPIFGRNWILGRKQPLFEDENNKYVGIKILFAGGRFLLEISLTQNLQRYKISDRYLGFQMVQTRFKVPMPRLSNFKYLVPVVSIRFQILKLVHFLAVKNDSSSDFEN